MIFVTENEINTLSAGHYSDATIEADTLRGARYGKNVHVAATGATTAEDLTQAFSKLYAADIERCYITGWKDGLVTAAIVESDQITSADYEYKQKGVDQKVVLVIEDTESSFDIAYPGVVGGTDTVTAFETAIRNAESKRNSCTLYYEDVLLDDEINSPSEVKAIAAGDDAAWSCTSGENSMARLGGLTALTKTYVCLSSGSAVDAAESLSEMFFRFYDEHTPQAARVDEFVVTSQGGETSLLVEVYFVDRWELTARITDAQTKEDYGRYTINVGDVGDALAAFTVRSLVAAQETDDATKAQLR